MLFQIIQKGYLINGLVRKMKVLKRENVGLQASLSSLQAPHYLEKLLVEHKITLQSPTFRQIVYVSKEDRLRKIETFLK